VQPERLWILFRPAPGVDLTGAVAVGDELALGGSRELLEQLIHDRPGLPFVLLLGYAGWAPLQAEHEIAQGAWVPMPIATDLVFDVPLEKRWEVAVRRLGLDPGEFLVGSGGARA
jgi:putative transcriptional regulator